jgi:peptidoglycan/xylan/chitin deacetylase (PgdA/CDA1 family)
VTSDSSESICNAEGLHLHRPIFQRLMMHVAANYRAVPLSRIVDWLEGRAGVPERAVAITFDDGFRNVLTDAAPVLKHLGLPATLFVATDFVFERKMLWPDRLLAALALTRETRLALDVSGEAHEFDLTTPHGKLGANQVLNAACKTMGQEERHALLAGMMERLRVDETSLFSAWEGFRPIDPDELRLLKGAGITVGAHTCTHPILALLSPAEQAREMTESKRRLEKATGVRCDEFAYPNGGPGDFSAQTRKAAVDAGYRCAFTTIKRRVSAGDDRYEIPRCTLTHNRVTLAEFSAELSGLSGALRAMRDRSQSRGTGVAPVMERLA